MAGGTRVPPYRHHLKVRGHEALRQFTNSLHDRHLAYNAVATMIGLLSILLAMVSGVYDVPALLGLGFFGLLVAGFLFGLPYGWCAIHSYSAALTDLVAVRLAIVQLGGLGGLPTTVLHDQDRFGRRARAHLSRAELDEGEAGTFVSLVDEWHGSIDDLIEASRSL